MHLRAPSTDRGVQSFIWSLVFFLILYFGMVVVDVSKATALIISLVSRVPDLPVRPHPRRGRHTRVVAASSAATQRSGS